MDKRKKYIFIIGLLLSILILFLNFSNSLLGKQLTEENLSKPSHTVDANSLEMNTNKRINSNYIYNSVSEMKSDLNLKNGFTATTLGYYFAGDGGKAMYKIRKKSDLGEDTQGYVLILDNGNVAELIAENNTINFKQFGAKEDGITDDTIAVQHAVSYAIARRILPESEDVYKRGIDTTAYGAPNVVSGGNLKISRPINVKFNFTFNKITYVGDQYALIIDSVKALYIKGNKIYIPSTASGNGIKLSTSTTNTQWNKIEIRHINVKAVGKNCVDILPVNGFGIMENSYFFGYLQSNKGKGINTFIPANSGKYSWEGEDNFFINVAVCDIAVNLQVDSVNNMSQDGTITGLTFHHISVEGSRVGIQMKCGLEANPNNGRQEAGIKSIIVHNMRCFEQNKTKLFLDADGYIRSCQIDTTSPIVLSQWKMRTSSGIFNRINAAIISPKNKTIIGENLVFKDFKTIIEKPL